MKFVIFIKVFKGESVTVNSIEFEDFVNVTIFPKQKSTRNVFFKK